MNRAGPEARAGELDQAIRVLSAAGVPAPESEARWLLEAVSGMNRTERLRRGAPPTRAELERVTALAARRAAGEPLQYLTGRAGFRSLELEVGPGVFIPRPETESLVDVALAHLPEGAVVVDVGTGSGAIAAALATERPDLTVYATESAPSALGYARRNLDALAPRVTLLEGDLLQRLPREVRGAVDVVVSNPPYVARQEALPREVVDYEPHEALFADGGGLAMIERLVTAAREWLRPGGSLIVEIGEQQDEAVRRLFALKFASVDIHEDLLRRPRIAVGRLETVS